MFGFGKGKSEEEKQEDRRLDRRDRETNLNKKDAKIEARRKNGGAGFSVKFYNKKSKKSRPDTEKAAYYEMKMPDGTRKKVKKYASRKVR
ncbi:MAG: hypothetical protein RBR26_10595 [Methanosarcina mazei]|nr:hypothetical protein [Methanosarcina mazei]